MINKLKHKILLMKTLFQPKLLVKSESNQYYIDMRNYISKITTNFISSNILPTKVDFEIMNRMAIELLLITNLNCDVKRLFIIRNNKVFPFNPSIEWKNAYYNLIQRYNISKK